MVRGTGREESREGSKADRKGERLSRRNVKLFTAGFLHKDTDKWQAKMLCSVCGDFKK